MAERGTVARSPDPFKTDGGNPRPWLVVSGERMAYPDEESIAVAFTTQSHHAGSFAVPSEAWVRDEPGQQSYVPLDVRHAERRPPRRGPVGLGHRRIHRPGYDGHDLLLGQFGGS